ncbi:MAG: hypothetical protein LUG56_04715 [Lachnospiraceae bacterium]|nr:hypothetical protein [Lachnospiraceae bacterium]
MILIKETDAYKLKWRTGIKEVKTGKKRKKTEPEKGSKKSAEKNLKKA